MVSTANRIYFDEQIFGAMVNGRSISPRLGDMLLLMVNVSFTSQSGGKTGVVAKEIVFCPCERLLIAI